MRWGSLFLLLIGALVLLGSDCQQELFAPISCEDQTDCEVACEELCALDDQIVMSAECDANGFCDCFCMPAQ